MLLILWFYAQVFKSMPSSNRLPVFFPSYLPLFYLQKPSFLRSHPQKRHPFITWFFEILINYIGRLWGCTSDAQCKSTEQCMHGRCINSTNVGTYIKRYISELHCPFNAFLEINSYFSLLMQSLLIRPFGCTELIRGQNAMLPALLLVLTLSGECWFRSVTRKDVFPSSWQDTSSQCPARLMFPLKQH